MKQHARWIACGTDAVTPCIRKTFYLAHPVRASIDVTGLGYFELYVNGVRVGEDYYVPAQSDYIKRDTASFNYPIHDTFTHRVYYLNYDISAFVKQGDNVLEMVLGNGQFRQRERVAEGRMSFGDELCARFALTAVGADGDKTYVVSDGSEMFRSTEVVACQLYLGERHDFTAEIGKSRPVHVITMDTELTKQECPTDRVMRVIRPRLLRRENGRALYDAGENVSGFAVLCAFAGASGELRVSYAEELNGDGGLDAGSTGWNYCGASGEHQMQSDSFVLDGNERRLAPRFCWHAFRYFVVSGEGYDADNVTVEVVHSDVAVTASFDSDSEALNWLYDAFIRTQLDSMHGGVPFDCPHRERLGYTGDGQVCADAGMLLFDSRTFYDKWMQDILDCQDVRTGHVQHTAPFMGGGGGPCGWGGAIVEVPYRHWQNYRDLDDLHAWYGAMCRYVDYIESRCEHGLVVREEEGGWCLGDWASIDEMRLPEPFVNSVLFVRQLGELGEMAEALGKTGDVARYRALGEIVRAAILREYYHAESGSFHDGTQGADAYALMIGLAPDGRVADNLVRYYRALGYFDTGFIGTEILVEQLCLLGEADLAYELLTTEQKGSYLWMKRQGATTLYEYFDGRCSHCHPMFGACVRSVFRYMLGIRPAGADGIRRIAPLLPSGMTRMKGSVACGQGVLTVSLARERGVLSVTVDVPSEHDVRLILGEREYTLAVGENCFTIE